MSDENNIQLLVPPLLNPDFFDRLDINNSDGKEKQLLNDENYLKNILTKEISRNEAYDRMNKSTQEKVTVKEIVIETETDLLKSLKQLKTVFKEEVANTISKLNDLYRNESLKLQKVFREELLGKGLTSLVKAVSTQGWYLIMKENSVNLYKYYSPMFGVNKGYTDDGSVREYEDSVCSLKGIYINIMHPKITSGTIQLSTEGWHPNCNNKSFGSACVGTLDERNIPIENPEAMVSLLREISSTYERIHLDSCYYKPDTSYSEKKGEVLWKAS